MSSMGDVRDFAGAFLQKSLRSALASLIEMTRNEAHAGGQLDRLTLNLTVAKDDFLRRIESGGAPWFEASLKFADEYTSRLALGLKDVGYEVMVLEALLVSRGKVGVGGGFTYSLFEQGLAVDPLLGLPYYPASSIKGAVRNYCEDEEMATPVQEESVCEALFGRSDKEVKKAFMGSIVFLPAYPIACARGYPCTVLQGDIDTPHYYKGGEPTSGEVDVTPVPIPSLSASPGLVFRFILYAPPGPRPYTARGVNPERGYTASGIRWGEEPPLRIIGAGPDLNHVATLLVNVLQVGIGARSAKGYNRLVPLPVLEREVGELPEFTHRVLRIHRLTHPRRREGGGRSRREQARTGHGGYGGGRSGSPGRGRKRTHKRRGQGVQNPK